MIKTEIWVGAIPRDQFVDPDVIRQCLLSSLLHET